MLATSFYIGCCSSSDDQYSAEQWKMERNIDNRCSGTVLLGHPVCAPNQVKHIIRIAKHYVIGIAHAGMEQMESTHNSKWSTNYVSYGMGIAGISAEDAKELLARYLNESSRITNLIQRSR